MSYLALARKWRPKNFSEVIGQSNVVRALSNALDSQRVHHAFLFSGTRGVGKTTLARIFAKALNCERGVSASPCGECGACLGVIAGNFVDLIEVDAASRTKVDDTRELLDNVQYTPTIGRYKIYLIDEVHMLTTHSFNALLKTLEEPPEHVKFLLATTNPHKLPTTILSRCIQFNLKAVDTNGLETQLQKILDAEDIRYDLSALNILARAANGSVRDALSLLDQAIAFSQSKIKSDQVRDMLGMVSEAFIVQLLTQVAQHDGKAMLNTVAQMSEQAIDFKVALDDLMVLIHNLSLFHVSPDSLKWKSVDEPVLADLSGQFDQEHLQLLFQFAVIGKRDFDFAPDPRSAFEAVLLRMLAFQFSSANQDSHHEDEKTKVPHRPTVLNTQNLDSDSIVSKAPLSDAEKTQPVTTTRYTSPKELLDAKNWHAFSLQCDLGGIAKQLLMNMVPQSYENQVLCVRLDSNSKHLFSKERKQRIEKYLVQRFTQDIVLDVKVEDLNGLDKTNMTPAKQIAQKKKDRQKAAEIVFSEDGNIRNIIDMFDAKVVPDSIQPSKDA